jgi:fluoroquinolone transport system permease protein
MNQLGHLLKHDFMLLSRNNVITISIIVTLIYVGLFKLLSALGNIEKVLVTVIFNDPALLGFLFVGVMVLFEKNENTIQALAVSPVKISNYILSKSISLTLVSLLCCFAMAISGYGMDFNFIHFSMAAIFTTMVFSFLGFIAVAGQSNFNQYILRALGIILFLSLPFLGYFDLVAEIWFVLFPTYTAIKLFDFAFQEKVPLQEMIFIYLVSVFWIVLTFNWALHTISKNFRSL